MPGYLSVSGVLLAAAGFGFLTLSAAPPPDGVPEAPTARINADANGLALKGYDPVSYFVDEEPRIGDMRFEVEHMGVAYRFSSQENQDLFTQNPDAYLPQLGGYSVFGMAKGKRYDVDPTTWDIVDGKLYLSRNDKVRELWHANPTGYLDQATSNWEDLGTE